MSNKSSFNSTFLFQFINTKHNVLNICSDGSKELNHSAIERLRRSVVVHNVVTEHIVQRSEHGQLGGGDVVGGEEVDPVDNLVTARSGEGPVVRAVDGGRRSSNRSHATDQVRDLEVGILHRDRGLRVGYLGQLLHQGSEGTVVLGLEIIRKLFSSP